MAPMVQALDSCSLPFCPPLGFYFKDTFSELRMCRTQFNSEKESLNIPLVRILKEHDDFSFQQFSILVKTYLASWGESVSVELDT